MFVIVIIIIFIFVNYKVHEWYTDRDKIYEITK